MFCEDLLYRRISFTGFNLEVEKLLHQMNFIKDETMKFDVSVEEIVKRHETLVGRIGEKNFPKRETMPIMRKTKLET